MRTNEKIHKLITDITQDKSNNKFKKYISSIKFPYYKNFIPFSEINFEFPLTVLVGKNGCGKSSILHALYGCPRGQTPAYYWFSTTVDPIKDGDGKGMPQCFVYSYYEDGNFNQTVMRRSSRPGTKTKRKNLDYWETDKIKKMYRMKISGNRRPPIDWNCLYLDFRQELSAYDKFFYFGSISDIKTVTKQDFIRRVSPKLQKAFRGKSLYSTNNHKIQNKLPHTLTKTELHFISEILGTEYVSGRIVYHHFFRNWGISALIKKKDFQYTEAHAGSGEFTVIQLVHKLCSISTSSLILLDEPETSLYPGAQKRLLLFLLTELKRTKSQIIIATHSEKFISCLPDNAIKSISVNSNIKEINNAIIKNSSSPNEVFNELEIPVSSNCTVFVEDEATKLLLDSVIKTMNIDANIISVEYTHEGADSLQKLDILQSSLHQLTDWFYLLDGDKRIEKVAINNLSVKEAEDPNFINSAIEKISKKIPFPSSKGRNEKHSTSKDEIKLDAQRKYLEYYYTNVDFLPENTPEDIIWNEPFLNRICKLYQIQIELNKSDKKGTLHDIACKKIGDSKINNSEYYAFFKELTQQLINSSNEQDKENVRKIQGILENFLSLFEKKHKGDN